MTLGRIHLRIASIMRQSKPGSVEEVIAERVRQILRCRYDWPTDEHFFDPQANRTGPMLVEAIPPSESAAFALLRVAVEQAAVVVSARLHADVRSEEI